MVQDKELEIRLMFLEEASEYLNTIESAILGLATSLVDNQKMDAVLRAAHSIKGGAAMMGFETLSELAHRLEDLFKVLKKQKPSTDDELESLLLDAIDHLASVIALNRQGTVVDEQWLQQNANPVFDLLYQRLGTPTPNDTLTLPEESQDMVSMIFETEVEGCLQRLESVLADPERYCLAEEISTMAEELGGLGEMLELPAFSSLCESVNQHLEANPEQAEDIAHLALQGWRTSQAALLVGQVDALPTQIDLSDKARSLSNSATNRLETDSVELSQPEPQNEAVQPWSTTGHNNDVQAPDLKTVHLSVLSEPKPELAPTTEFKESQDTVRVPVKQLDQLNDLFGELTIERNGLDVNLERLRNLVRILASRVRTLKQFDTQLRTAYEKAGEQDRAAKESVHPDPLAKNSPTPRLDLLPEDLMETIVRIQEVTDDIDLTLEDTDQTVGELNRTAKQMQTSLTQVRMRPLTDLVGRFPRFVRELCLQYGKNVDLKIHGGETLVDRSILEALSDPLMHLLRNAFDHGLEDPATRRASGKPEQGVIEITAAYQGNQTLISVIDDGKGIDLDKIQEQAKHLGLDAAAIAVASDEELLSLIFEPGFSTAGQVTALSGRGVGLDVVRTNLRQIRGDIKVDTQLGVGTTFTLSVPLTLSIARVILVESNKMLLAFPTDALVEMILLNPEQILTIAGKEVLDWQGTMAPLIRLSHWLEFKCPQVAVETDAMPIMSAPTVLMIPQGNELIGLQVDRCWGEQEVAIRQVEGTIAMPPGFTGCTILGDGRVVPLVNAPDLLHWIASCKQSYSFQQADKSPTTPTLQNQKDTILIVDDSINVRRFLSLSLEKAGYRVELAKDGQDALEKLLDGLQVKAVICDIDMPRLDGYGLLARVKSDPAFKQLPIAMLTSRGGDKHRQLAMNLGATAYFSKPYNEQELLKTLKQLI